MKIEIIQIEGFRRLTLCAENQAEHYQIIALSESGGILRRNPNPYFSLNLYLKEEGENER